MRIDMDRLTKTQRQKNRWTTEISCAYLFNALLRLAS